MNVNQITDIYTNLGRLGRDGLKREQPSEGAVNPGQTEENSPVLVPAEPRTHLGTAADQGQTLNLGQARQLTSTIEGQILETAQRPWSLGFLKVEQASIITPRYV